MSTCLLFVGPTEQQRRIGSDSVFWNHVTEMLADAEKVYAAKLNKVGRAIQDRLANNEAFNCNSVNKECMKMSSMLEELQTKVLATSRAAEQAMHNFQVQQTKIQRCSNNGRDKLELKVAAHAHSDLRVAYQTRQRKIERAQEKYEKAKTEVEHKKVCVLRMAKNPDKARRSLQRIAEAEAKAELAEIRYRNHVMTGADSFQLMKSASRQHEDLWRTDEVARTTTIVHFIQEYTSSCMKIKVEEMIEDLTDRELVTSSEFEEYKDTLLTLVQSKLVADEDTPTKQPLRYKDYQDDLVRVGHVTRPFKQKDDCCLHLKKGLQVTQLIPTTSKGWAFGEICTGTGLPQYGYYPVCCVEYRQRFSCRRTLTF